MRRVIVASIVFAFSGLTTFLAVESAIVGLGWLEGQTLTHAALSIFLSLVAGFISLSQVATIENFLDTTFPYNHSSTNRSSSRKPEHKVSIKNDVSSSFSISSATSVIDLFLRTPKVGSFVLSAMNFAAAYSTGIDGLSFVELYVPQEILVLYFIT